MMESLTQQLVDGATEIIDEVEALGGMANAVVSGSPLRSLPCILSRVYVVILPERILSLSEYYHRAKLTYYH